MRTAAVLFGIASSSSSSSSSSTVAFFVSLGAALWWKALRALLLSTLFISGVHAAAFLYLSGEAALLTWRAAGVLVGVAAWHALSMALRAAAAEGACRLRKTEKGRGRGRGRARARAAC